MRDMSSAIEILIPKHPRKDSHTGNVTKRILSQVTRAKAVWDPQPTTGVITRDARDSKPEAVVPTDTEKFVLHAFREMLTEYIQRRYPDYTEVRWVSSALVQFC